MTYEEAASNPGFADETAASVPGDLRRQRPRLFNGDTLCESLAVFLIGAALMHFFYAGTGGLTGDELGVPGNDSFYHIKMAAMLPEWGLVKEFPWLRFAYFTDEGQPFVSHHYGFHVLMAPFVQLSHSLYGDYLAGGRWATCFFFGATLVVFNLLLFSAGVRWRWIWLLLFLVMPSQFFTRHAFVRAITPSLMFMLAIVLFMFRERHLLAGLAVAGFTHLYLGGVMFAPVVVVIYTIALVIGPREERVIPWKMVAFTLGGWLLGVFTYPYAEGMYEFLKLQVFGTGPTPDIPVGQEWLPYDGLWWVAKMVGPTMLAWGAALAIRLRFGPRLDAKELSLVLTQFAFLVLMAKSRRFVEYWPVFCLLSAAYLSAPQMRMMAEWFDRLSDPQKGLGRAFAVLCVLIAPIALAIPIFYVASQYDFMRARMGEFWNVVGQLKPFLVEWETWTALCLLYVLVPVVRRWFGRSPSKEQLPVDLLFITVLCVVFASFVGLAAHILIRNGSGGPLTGKLRTDLVGWGLLGPMIAVVVSVVRTIPREGRPEPLVAKLDRAAFPLVAAVFVLAFATFAAGGQILDIQRSSRCQYNLSAIRGMMKYVTEHSNAGDVIFTDDWDVFPVYFYHNSYNNYIVGLDPMFTNKRRPDLWQRYVKISRGEVPADTFYTPADGGKKKEIHVRLEDIRDIFQCKFVITDRDHKQFSSKLASAKHLAELVYPMSDYAKARDQEYLVFRILDSGQSPEATPPEADTRGDIYLSALTPVSVDQGWGDLTMDRSVGGGDLNPGDKEYTRGLGTHAPSQLVYDIPPGFEFFEATVGVNRSTGGNGSIFVSVSLDGAEPVITSPVLTGNSEPFRVRIGLGGAKRITLKANPTPDGMRFDHVDWADARFVRADQ